jgi:hypothetical protein
MDFFVIPAKAGAHGFLIHKKKIMDKAIEEIK